jgi:hypothetical protein
MGVGGGLWNPEVGRQLRELRKVVDEAAQLPERTERPKVERPRRPGWVVPLVREVLADSPEPMTAQQIARAIRKRFPTEKVERPAVLYALTRSRQALRNKEFERVEPARYRLRAS